MFWQEDTEQSTDTPDNIIDLAFRLESAIIPLDHAEELNKNLVRHLPWLEDEEGVGVHMIHVAASGNGWMRPEDQENEVLCLSNRTRLNIRIPKSRLEDANQLVGNTLNIGDASIKIGKSQVKPLSDSTTIFSRYISCEANLSEQDFLQQQLQNLKNFDIKPKKMLCGMENVFTINAQKVHTKSIMLAELTSEESILLQRTGLGPLRTSGFGLFIPHKGIAPVFSKD